MALAFAAHLGARRGLGSGGVEKGGVFGLPDKDFLAQVCSR